MSETTDQLPTQLDHSDEAIVADARRAEAWAGESFLREGEEPARVMAPGTARRRALDDAIAEINKGNETPSPEWKVRYALMLGLERVLSEKPPHLASGLELRRHQVDALAGMLTELIAASQRQVEAAFSNGHLPEEAELEEEEEEENGFGETHLGEEEELIELTPEQDPGAVRRFRFRHPTASGKTIAAAGFVEASRTLGVLILTHRRLLVSQFRHDLTETGYAKRFSDVILRGHRVRKVSPITIQTYAWFARHHAEVEPTAYQLVICDEAHTALGEKTSAAIRAFPDPIFIGMTATEQLIAKQVSDVFPASVDDLPLQDAARRGLIAPLRCLRVPPVAAIHSVPIVGGDFDERALAQVLDHTALNQAAASLYRDRFDDTPGIVYAAGVDHAYNLAQEFRAAGLKAEAVSGRTPPVKLAETLAAYERGEINVLINAQLLAEGWNSPRATVCMHLAPTASRRVYQQRIGRIMRTHARKEAGVVVDFVPKSATHSEKVISLHSLLGADFYREGARVTPAPRRRMQRRARRRLAPAPWLVPVTPDVKRRLAVIAREWQRIDPKYLDTDEQRFWAMIAGRSIRYEERADFVRKLIEGNTSKVALEQFLFTCAAENSNRRLRLMALVDRVSTPVETGRLRRSGHARDSGAHLGEGALTGNTRASACSRRGQSRRSRTDSRSLALALGTSKSKSPGPQGERGVHRCQAPARRGGQLSWPAPRRECRPARQRGPRAAAARWSGPAGLGRGLHASGHPIDRSGARATSRHRRDRGGPGRESADAQASVVETEATPEATPRDDPTGRKRWHPGGDCRRKDFGAAAACRYNRCWCERAGGQPSDRSGDRR